MKFCSNCGHTISFGSIEGDERPRFHCESCKVIHYQNPKIVAGCIPIWEDKVLLCKRAIEPRKGYWNVPGGYLENGETVEAGAAREVWEEALAKVTVTQLHLLYSIPRINQVYIHFLANLDTLDFGVGIESLEVALFTEAEIPWKDIAFTSSKLSLQYYFEDRKKGKPQVHVNEFDITQLEN